MTIKRQRPAPGLIQYSDRGIQGGLNRPATLTGWRLR